MLLQGKNIIVTGSGRGIGKAVAIACTREGANIGLLARTLEELNHTKQEIEALGSGVNIAVKTADITNYDEVADAFKYFHDNLGLLNGVVANAGASRMGNTHEFDNEKFANIINVNILGVFHTFKAAYPYLKKDDKNEKARFIITGSAAYPMGMPKFTAYVAAKYAVVGIQNVLVAEYKKENINFNMVLPTQVDTRMLRSRKAGDGNKPDHVLNPWDLNEYYLFLLSDYANRVDNALIYSSDFTEVKKFLSKAPSDKAESWEVFKAYLEENSPKIYAKVKKLGNLVDFVIKSSK